MRFLLHHGNTDRISVDVQEQTYMHVLTTESERILTYFIVPAYYMVTSL